MSLVISLLYGHRPANDRQIDTDKFCVPLVEVFVSKPTLFDISNIFIVPTDEIESQNIHWHQYPFAGGPVSPALADESG